jgi:hypothetical protein
MSNNIFDKDGIDEIVRKIKADKTGRLSKTMQDIMDVCEKAGRYGFTLKEISIIGTTGWYLSQNPEMREFFDTLIKMPPMPEPDEDIYN